jgi:branched-chain amino acid transport system substrate-binding protein
MIKTIALNKVARRNTGAMKVAAFALASVFAASVAAQPKDFTIGVVTALTGPLAPLGVDMKNGYEIAVKHYPKVRGMNVKLVSEDDQTTPATGVRKAQKLVLEDRANLIVGFAASSVVLAVAGQAAKLNVPIVTTNAQAVQVTGEQCNKLVFRTNPNDAMTVNAAAALMKKRTDLLQKNWFVIYHDFVWGHSNKGEFAKIPGIKIVGEAGRPVGTADWASAIAQIQRSGADGIYLALAVGDDLPAFIKQSRSFGLKHVMLPPIGMPDAMLQVLGDSGVGIVTGGLFGSWMLEDKNEQIARFNRDYFAAFGKAPGPQSIQAYAGMQLVMAAVEKAKSISTPDLVAALESTPADTIIGRLAIRKEDHQGMVGVFESEAIKLPAPKYGQTVGWKVNAAVPWDSIKVDLPQTGCKGL